MSELSLTITFDPVRCMTEEEKLKEIASQMIAAIKGWEDDERW